MIVLVAWNIYGALNRGRREVGVPVVILKLPRSGSSWFTSELNGLSSVFISKEIVQRNDSEMFDTVDIERHLVNALTHPVGKLSNSRNYLPDARFIEDYIVPTRLWKWKPLNRLKLIGFTVNPEHIPDIDWGRVAKEVPGLKVVALVRNNLIKIAISDYTGRVIKGTCGSANLRAHESQNKCKDIVQVPWDAAQLQTNVGTWHRRREAFLLSMRKIQKSIDSTAEPYVVTYEEMQVDKAHTLLSLFRSLGVRNTGMEPFLSPEEETWTKRGQEKLSTILTNYDSVEKVLESCTCLLQQLREEAPSRSRKVPSCAVATEGSKVCDFLS